MDIFEGNFKNFKNNYVRSFASLIFEGGENHLLFIENKSSRKSLVKTIKGSTSTSKKNLKQLKLTVIQLIPPLQQCPKSILNVEGERWLKFCIENLKENDINLKKCLLGMIASIIRATEGNKELQKKLSEHVTQDKLMERLCSCQPMIKEERLKCLYEIVRLFPVKSLTQKKLIEKSVTTVLTSFEPYDRNLVCAAASVYAVLPVPGGESTVAEKKGSQLEQLISLSHYVADNLFSDIIEHEKYDFTRDHKFAVEKIEVVLKLRNPLLRTFAMSLVLQNCFDFIKTFLEKSCSHHIVIKHKDLINIFFRVLQVEVQSFRKKQSIEANAIALIIPSLHSRALEVLQYFIRNNICPTAMYLVEEQLVLTLKSTNGPTLFKQKVEKQSSKNAEALQQFLKVRIHCYEALTEVAKVSGVLNENFMEALLSNLIADIQPVRDPFSVKEGNAEGEPKLKRKRGSDQCREAFSHVALAGVVSQRIPLTISALRFIEAFFTYAHHSCHVKYVKILQDELVNLLKRRRRTGIYGDERVRESLFCAVIANIQNYNPLCPPHFNYLQSVLQKEALHSRGQVLETLERGLSSFSFIYSNPSAVTWSEIVNLNKVHSKNIEVKTNEEESVRKDDIINGESNMSDDENDEALDDAIEEIDGNLLEEDDDEKSEDEGENDDAIEEIDDLLLNLEEDDDEKSEGEGENDDVKVNGVETTDDDDKNGASFLGNVNRSVEEHEFAEDLNENDLQEDDDDEDSFGEFDMNLNISEVEEVSEEEEEDIEVSDDDYDEVDFIGIGVKRRTDSDSDQSAKRNKVESDDSIPLLVEELPVDSEHPEAVDVNENKT